MFAERKVLTDTWLIRVFHFHERGSRLKGFFGKVNELLLPRHFISRIVRPSSTLTDFCIPRISPLDTNHQTFTNGLLLPYTTFTILNFFEGGHLTKNELSYKDFTNFKIKDTTSYFVKHLKKNITVPRDFPKKTDN